MAHAVEQHQPGAADGLGDRPSTCGPHQLVGHAVDHDGRRGDLPVVAAQAAAAQDRAEMPGDADGVVAAVVGLGRVGADTVLGGRVARGCR